MESLGFKVYFLSGCVVEVMPGFSIASDMVLAMFIALGSMAAGRVVLVSLLSSVSDSVGSDLVSMVLKMS